ncbi:MAG: transposase family protein [Planctomycetes bacterium]|nr:transposase family protein [Planctomycetota bacterium]
MSRTRVTMDEVLCHFEELKDPRSEINRKHPLVSVVVIAILGVLAQANGQTAIAACTCVLRTPGSGRLCTAGSSRPNSNWQQNLWNGPFGACAG